MHHCINEMATAARPWMSRSHPIARKPRVGRRKSGISQCKFFELLKDLAEAGKVHKSVVDGKWEQILEQSRN